MFFWMLKLNMSEEKDTVAVKNQVLVRPSRAGQRWTDEENALLMEHVSKGTSVDEMTKVFQRTSNALSIRLSDKALKQMKETGITMDEAAKQYGVTTQDLEKRQTRKQEDRVRTRKATTTKPVAGANALEYMPILVEIRDMLRVLVGASQNSGE
jgi:transposase